MYRRLGTSAAVGVPIAEHVVQLGGEAIRAFGRLGEQVERIEQDKGGRLVSGEDQGHDLVAELAIGHAASPLLVARGQEARQEVARVLAAARDAAG